MTKKLIISFFAIISLGVSAQEAAGEAVKNDKNPLKELVADKVFEEGMARFIKAKRDMFDNKLLNAGEQKQKLNARFNTLVALLQKSGVWNATFYYNDKNGKQSRKTIIGREIMRIDGDGYYLQAGSGGLRVTDLKTGTSILLEKGSRW